MKRYAYVDKINKQSTLSQLASRFSPETPSENDVKNHVSLLIGQAIFLVLLSLVYIGFEAYTVKLEANTQTPTSRIVEETAPTLIADINSKPAVLGTDVIERETTTPQEEKIKKLPKDIYFIALTGDSIVETMGKDTPHLVSLLEEEYPETTFITYNYAVGARNVSQNLKDFHEPFNYKDRHYESIDTLKPDIIIVGSSAYNVFDPHDTNHHWLEYTRLIQEALTITPHVYMLAEHAPLRSGFGFGVDGIVWEPATAWVHTGRIIEHLNNVLGLSRTLGIPIIDAYTPSLSEDGQSGRRELINAEDNIHLSDQGLVFISELIVEILDFERIR